MARTTKAGTKPGTKAKVAPPSAKPAGAKPGAKHRGAAGPVAPAATAPAADLTPAAVVTRAEASEASLPPKRKWEPEHRCETWWPVTPGRFQWRSGYRRCERPGVEQIAGDWKCADCAAAMRAQLASSALVGNSPTLLALARAAGALDTSTMGSGVARGAGVTAGAGKDTALVPTPSTIVGLGGLARLVDAAREPARSSSGDAEPGMERDGAADGDG